MRNAEFNDPRLVIVYDAECPWSRDDDFFLSVVNQTPGARVLDLGCGTGRLALGLSAAGAYGHRGRPGRFFARGGSGQARRRPSHLDRRHLG